LAYFREERSFAFLEKEGKIPLTDGKRLGGETGSELVSTERGGKRESISSSGGSI